MSVQINQMLFPIILLFFVENFVIIHSFSIILNNLITVHSPYLALFSIRKCTFYNKSIPYVETNVIVSKLATNESNLSETRIVRSQKQCHLANSTKYCSLFVCCEVPLLFQVRNLQFKSNDVA